jgi:CheY-like chemotaxis protein
LGTGRKLLLADDSVTIQKVVDLTFVDEGMQVVTVSDGEQAVRKLEEFVPDIVLLDVFMPKLNGYQVCERIKSDERLRHIPVMLLVGSFEPFDLEEARRVGADDYLTKPFQSIKQLINKVGALVGRSNDEQPEQSDEVATTTVTASAEHSDFMPEVEMKESEASTQDLTLTVEAAHAAEAERERQAYAPMSAEALEVSTANTAPLPPQRGTMNFDDPFGMETMANRPFTETMRGEPDKDFNLVPELVESGTGATPAIVNWTEMSSESADQNSATNWNDQIGEETLISAPRPAQLAELNTHTQPQTAMPAPSNYSSQTALTADDALLDLDDSVPSYPSFEDDDAILDIQYPSAPTLAPAADSMDASTLNAYEAEIVEAAPEAEGFVDAQMLGAQEISATGYAPVQEQAGVSTSAASGTSHFTGQIGLDQLSPEAIEAIARRAVEMLSERVVQEIAWEVVPQLAELLIKRRLEEEKTRTH